MKTESKCEEKITVSQLKSNDDLKNEVKDYQQGGNLHKDRTKNVKKKEERPSERIVREYIQEASNSELELRDKYNLCKNVSLVADGGSLEIVEKNILKATTQDSTISPPLVQSSIKVSSLTSSTNTLIKEKISSNPSAINNSNNQINEDYSDIGVSVTSKLDIISDTQKDDKEEEEEEYSEIASLDENKKISEVTKSFETVVKASESCQSKIDSLTTNENKPAVVDQEEEEEEEYGESMSGDVSNVEANLANVENVNAANEDDEEEEEYGECMSGTVNPVVVKQEQTEFCPNIKKEQTEDSNAIFNCPDNFSFSAPNSVESNFDSDNLDQFPSPKKEPGLCTPTSSGYWSDDAKVIIWSDI